MAAAIIERDNIHVTVENIEDARLEILKNVSKYDWPLTQFTVNRASLEDVFLKAVN